MRSKYHYSYVTCRKSCNSADNFSPNPKSLKFGQIFPFAKLWSENQIVVVFLFRNFLLLPHFLLLLHHIDQRFLLAKRNIKAGNHIKLVSLLFREKASLLLLVDDSQRFLRLSFRTGIVFAFNRSINL